MFKSKPMSSVDVIILFLLIGFTESLSITIRFSTFGDELNSHYTTLQWLNVFVGKKLSRLKTLEVEGCCVHGGTMFIIFEFIEIRFLFTRRVD